MDAVSRIAVRDTTWHGKETDVGNLRIGDHEKITIAAAIRRIGADYKVHRLVPHVQMPGSTEWFPIDDRWAMMREATEWDPQPRRLRIPGPRYQEFQNEHFVHFFEDLAKQWPLYSFIILQKGSRVVMELKMDPYTIGGRSEEHHEVFLLVAQQWGAGSLLLREVHDRVVCLNTFQRAIARGKKEEKALGTIPHTGDVMAEVQFRKLLINHAIEARKQEIALMEALFKRRVEREEVNAVIEKALPTPARPRGVRLLDMVPDEIMARFENVDLGDEEAVEQAGVSDYAPRIKHGMQANYDYTMAVQRTESRRRDIARRYVAFNDKHPYAGETAYALFQAVTEHTNHSPLYKGPSGRKAVAVMFGNQNDTNARAHKALQELVK